MSSDGTTQNELVAGSDDPAAGGSSSSPAPTPNGINVEGEGVHGGRVRLADRHRQSRRLRLLSFFLGF